MLGGGRDYKLNGIGPGGKLQCRCKVMMASIEHILDSLISIRRSVWKCKMATSTAPCPEGVT